MPGGYRGHSGADEPSSLQAKNFWTPGLLGYLLSFCHCKCQDEEQRELNET